jgi:EmrB/QacA subfamily drug resistance transporter
MSETTALPAKLLWVISLSGFLTGFDYTALNIAMPTLASEFQATYSQVSWVLLAYALIFVAGAMPASNLMRAYGTRRVLMLGFVVYGVGSLCCIWAPTLLLLSMSRAVQAVGGTVLFVAGPALIRMQFPEGLRGRGYGVAALAPTIGLCLGPALGGLIVAELGWRWIFVVNLPVCVLGILFLLTGLKFNEQELGKGPLDIPGSVLFFATMIAFVFAINQGTEMGWASPLILATFSCSALGLTALVVRELHSPSAAMDLRLLAQPEFRHGALALFLLLFLIGGLGFCLPIFLEVIKGVSTKISGVILSVQPVVIVGLSMLSGAIAAWKGPNVRGILGSFVIMAALGLAMADTFSTGVWLIALALFGVGIGFALCLPSVIQMTLDPIAPARATQANGMLTTARTLGQLTGIVGFETVLSGYVGVNSHDISAAPDETGAFRVVFGIALGVTAAALFAIHLQSRNYHPNASTD